MANDDQLPRKSNSILRKINENYEALKYATPLEIRDSLNNLNKTVSQSKEILDLTTRMAKFTKEYSDQNKDGGAVKSETINGLIEVSAELTPYLMANNLNMAGRLKRDSTGNLITDNVNDILWHFIKMHEEIATHIPEVAFAIEQCILEPLENIIDPLLAEWSNSLLGIKTSSEGTIKYLLEEKKKLKGAILPRKKEAYKALSDHELDTYGELSNKYPAFDDIIILINKGFSKGDIESLFLWKILAEPVKNEKGFFNKDAANRYNGVYESMKRVRKAGENGLPFDQLQTICRIADVKNYIEGDFKYDSSVAGKYTEMNHIDKRIENLKKRSEKSAAHLEAIESYFCSN